MVHNHHMLLLLWLHFFNAPKEVEPSLIAWQMSAFDTLLHEQIVALSGSKSTPLPPDFAADCSKTRHD